MNQNDKKGMIRFLSFCLLTITHAKNYNKKIHGCLQKVHPEKRMNCFCTDADQYRKYCFQRYNRALKWYTMVYKSSNRRNLSPRFSDIWGRMYSCWIFFCKEGASNVNVHWRTPIISIFIKDDPFIGAIFFFACSTAPLY